jgi:hypothetical protein
MTRGFMNFVFQPAALRFEVSSAQRMYVVFGGTEMDDAYTYVHPTIAVIIAVVILVLTEVYIRFYVYGDRSSLSSRNF